MQRCYPTDAGLIPSAAAAHCRQTFACTPSASDVHANAGADSHTDTHTHTYLYPNAKAYPYTHIYSHTDASAHTDLSTHTNRYADTQGPPGRHQDRLRLLPGWQL
ncbi:MAG: hypothetical protein Q8O76_01640 [Chloroflexota bacterium]|nr:hypothetical protein [Chloroflexota bacterium]